VALIKTDTTSLIEKVDNLDVDTTSILADTTAIITKLDSLNDISVQDILNGAVDGTTVEYALELSMARVNGKYTIDTPNLGDIKFFKRDNTASLTVVNVTENGRTRIS
jgi:hypothetical protein